MLTFEQSKNVKPLCKIIGGKYNNKVISIDPNITEADYVNTFKKLEIGNSSKLQMVPNTSSERDVYYITGPSGSGKSYFVRLYCEQYKKKFKNNEIYLFSNLKEDESLDSIKPKRVRLDEELYLDPIKVEEFTNSLVIFDDTDCLSDKKVRNAVNSLLDQCLEVGRHYKITVLITFHLPSDRQATRKMLNECAYFVYFPQSSSSKIKYVLSNYLDVTDKQIKYFRKLNSRWICIKKNWPMCYVSEHSCGLLLNDDDD
jgi:Cdc6-like AAA superfamily ATPase